MRSTLALALLLLGSTTLPALAQVAPSSSTVSVTGTGEVHAAPDTAYINSGVTTQGATAREALDANTVAMEELIATLREAGIDRRDIQTSNFSVSPNYVYTDERDENGYTLPPRINGYVVSNSVTIRIRDLELLGIILDRSVTVGANTVNGISFEVADPSNLLDEARVDAFSDARDKAALYAVAAGGQLGTVMSIVEAQTFGQPEPMMMRQSAAMTDAASVPVEAGELTFSVSVTVTWSLAAGNDTTP